MELNGRKLATKKTIELKALVASFEKAPKMVIVQVGDDVASNKYINFKLKKAWEIGIDAEALKIEETISQEHLEHIIEQKLFEADGMIVQLPLPDHIDKTDILNLIPFEKDIDGLAKGNNIITPATPRGIMDLMSEYNVELKGKQVAVVGKSSLVGRPVADLCEKEGAIVSRYSQRTGIDGTENADVLIVAAGQPKLIKANNIKQDAIIIDVGINEIADANSMKKIVGDVDRDDIGSKAKAISPVPGGVGPMTVISLMANLIDIYKKNNN